MQISAFHVDVVSFLVPEVLNFVPIHDGRKVVRYHILLVSRMVRV